MPIILFAIIFANIINILTNKNLPNSIMGKQTGPSFGDI